MTPTQKEVLIAFADNDMNISKTARQKFMHRNTIMFHLGKIKTQTGLNPLNFYNLIELLKLCRKDDTNASN